MTGRIINNLIEVRQGDSYPINIQIKQGGKPVNLTGATLLMQVRDSENHLMFSLRGTAIDAAHGKITLLISPTETNIPVGDYLTDIQLTTEDGSVNTIFPANVNQVATFRITQQVTQEE